MTSTPFTKLIRAIALGAILLVSTVAAVDTADASASVRMRGVDFCSTHATGDGFVVTWNSNLNASQFIVERYAFNRFWWRGKVDSQTNSFDDGAAPAGAASMTYRLVARSGNGQLVGTVPCPMQTNDGFSCEALTLPDNNFKIEWSGLVDAPGNDVIVRRSVRQDGPSYWRAKTTGPDYLDTASPTGTASYTLYARTNNQITAYTTCFDGRRPEPCSPAATDLPVVECEAMLALNTQHLHEDPTTDPCNWDGITCAGGNVTEIALDNTTPFPLPPELANLSALQSLRLDNPGSVSGPIPAWLGDLTELRHLLLTGPFLTGSIPPELANLSNLQFLYIYGHALTGSIPPELGTLANLDRLVVTGTSLTGSIPPELGNLSNLERLTIHGNSFTGSIPPELGNLGSLERLSIHGNSFTGDVPAELGNLANLERLYLNSVALEGSLPPELGNLDALKTLNLQWNLLSGDITLAIAGLMDTLTEVELADDIGGNNCLTATDPAVIVWLDTNDPEWDLCE